MQGLEKLEIGRGYLYKELCATLGENETNNRKKQKERWNRFFIFEQVGRIYYVREIRKEPIPDGRTKGNNSKYIDYFKDIIMYHLPTNGEKIYKTQKDWFLNYNIVTADLYRRPTELVTEYNNLYRNHGFAYINNCQIDVRKFIENKFADAINNLTKAEFLDFEKTFMIIYQNENMKVANEEEALEINTVQKTIMKELGVESFLHAKYKKIDGVLNKKINEKLQELYGYKSVFRILGLQKNVKKDYNFFTESQTIARNNLLSLFNDGLAKYYTNKKQNNSKKVNDILEKWFNDEDISNEKISIIFEDDYVDNMTNIMQEFLSL
ncbi:MAG: hypothetical protein IJ306_06240 [Oscillospiraceae bacterium]|nr:hypothetical protein [Oscillospiraceae bacterium]